MKIAIVCDVLGEENNGATHAGMNLIRSLKEKGHTVNIICPDENKVGQDGYYVCPKLNLWPFNGYIRKVGVTIAKADEHVIEEGIKDADIVHLHLPFPMSNKAIKIAKKYNIPLTASFHMPAEILTSYLKLQKSKIANKIVYNFIDNHTYKHVDAIHFPTEYIKNTFETSINRKTNAYVISNGVNEIYKKIKNEKPTNLKDKFIILSTGRYCNEKAQQVLIKAVGLSKYKNHIQLILAGQGPKSKYYNKIAKSIGTSPIFKFFSKNELVDCLNYCDLYVHPANIEIEGIACLEAICCGKAVVVSDSKSSATNTFVTDDRCIFKNNNPEDLARKIDFLYENKTIREELGNLNLKDTKKYNHQYCMDEMERMLLETIELHKNKKGT